jgi:diguanylate cyclase (GGDEF)-like protein
LINVEQGSRTPGSDAAKPLDTRASDVDNEVRPLSILLVEDEGIVAQDMQEALSRIGYHIAGIASEGRQAVAMADMLAPDIVVMDVSLRGEVDGIQAARLMQQRTQMPIIFLTGHSDQETLQRAVTIGPMGYLIKPFQEAELHAAIEVAMHKHRADRELRKRGEMLQNLSLIDELTQIKNRRGFFELAAQALKVAHREQYPLGLFFMDVNGLKRINDTLGHLAGDQALRDAAEVLRHTFRDSDIVARIGGDEFVALAHVHGQQDMVALGRRLRQHLREFNDLKRRPYPLDFSIGMTVVDAGAEQDLQSLLAKADAAMYREKRSAAR